MLLIVLDDVGFAQLGCFGSPIRTIHLDRLAERGLRYTNLHTAALSAPTRSCLLTGRNHHANGMGVSPEASTGFPGYNGHMPFANGLLSEMLSEAGYATLCIGKWHLAPQEQTSAAGPHHRWPLGRGFDRYYGFLGASTHQYFPDLVCDNHPVDPPALPDEGYHLTADLADRAMQLVADAKQVAPDRPFFLFVAPGACHAPHHVPREWADRYRSAFDDGWDVYRAEAFARQKRAGVMPRRARLSAPDPDVADWDSLSRDARRLYARTMEVFAGFLEHTDHHIGRLLSFLRRNGELENTVTIVVSDNGASPQGGPAVSLNENRFVNGVPESLAESLAAIDELGGPRYFNHYHWGWAHAGNAPFRRWKRETYRGGVSAPCIVHWPAGIAARGEVRAQYVHAVDVVPTVLEALGVAPPGRIGGVPQSPLHGVSFANTLDDATARSRRTTQYFEMLAHRAIYHDGWRAVCPYPGPSIVDGAELGYGVGEPFTIDRLREREQHGWELYHVAEDISEVHDLASAEPAKLRELVALWFAEAGRYGVLPLQGPDRARFAPPRPGPAAARRRSVYWAGTGAVPERAAAHVLNRSHAIIAEVEIPAAGAAGVLLAHGGLGGGYSLFVQGGRLQYVHNYVGLRFFHVVSEIPVPIGRATLAFAFERTGAPDFERGHGAPGIGRIYIEGQVVGRVDIDVTIPLVIGLGDGLSCGCDSGSPVSPLYTPPFRFTGHIHQVVVEASDDDASLAAEALLREAIQRP